MSEKTVEVYVGIGMNGCKRSWDTGCTNAEWQGMTDKERDVAIDDCLSNILDVWTSYDGE